MKPMRITFLICSFILLTLGTFDEVWAKSHEIPEISVEVTVNADGTVTISEHLTYRFDGSFTWAEYNLPKQGFSAIRDIAITGPTGNYINENSEANGTFNVSENDEQIRLRWFFSAEDEQRTFTITYTLAGAVTVGPEWSQFFWNYISDERDKDTDQLLIEVNLPEAVASDSLHGWLRGPMQNMELQTSTGSFSVAAQNVNDNQFVKLRAVFPTSVFTPSEISVSDSDFSLAWARQDEQAFHEEQARKKKHLAYWQDTGQQLGYLLLVLSLGLFYGLYQKYGKRHSTTRFSDSETIMIPGDQKPAAIGWLLGNRTVAGKHLMATLLDLARQGYFTIEEKPAEEGWLSEDSSKFVLQRTETTASRSLTEWEGMLLEYLEKQIEEGESEINKIFGSSSFSFTNWLNDWKESLKSFCFDKGWIDQDSYQGAYLNAALQLVLFGITIGIMIYAGQFEIPTLIGALFVTPVIAIASLSIIRRTEDGERIYHKWKNYREGLQNADDYEISPEMLDRHFIYAVALGVGKNDIETLFASAGDTPTLAWIVLYGSSTPAEIASSFSTLAATGAATSSGASGGAGASAGAAGGGASASAG